MLRILRRHSVGVGEKMAGHLLSLACISSTRLLDARKLLVTSTRSRVVC